MLEAGAGRGRKELAVSRAVPLKALTKPHIMVSGIGRRRRKGPPSVWA